MREADGLKGKKMKVYDTTHFLLSSMFYAIL